MRCLIDRRRIRQFQKTCSKRTASRISFSPAGPRWRDRWTWLNFERWFKGRFEHLRKRCDRGDFHRGRWNNAKMIQQTMRSFLNMATQSPDGTWTVRDTVGSPPWSFQTQYTQPRIGFAFLITPVSTSIGHRIHGKPLTTGYPEDDMYPSGPSEHNPKRNNTFWNPSR